MWPVAPPVPSLTRRMTGVRRDCAVPALTVIFPARTRNLSGGPRTRQSRHTHRTAQLHGCGLDADQEAGPPDEAVLSRCQVWLIVRQSRGVGRYTGGPLAPGRGAGRRAESILGRVSPARPYGWPLARGSRPDLHGLPPGTNLRPSRKRRRPCDPGAGELRRSRDGARIGHSAPLSAAAGPRPRVARNRQGGCRRLPRDRSDPVTLRYRRRPRLPPAERQFGSGPDQWRSSDAR